MPVKLRRDDQEPPSAEMAIFMPGSSLLISLGLPLLLHEEDALSSGVAAAESMFRCGRRLRGSCRRDGRC